MLVSSTPEGEEKPLKYPHAFRASTLVLLNKMDLVPQLSFDVGGCAENVRRVAPRAKLLQVSARSGDGLEKWFAWIRARAATLRSR